MLRPRIGPYRLCFRLGRGGSCSVFAAIRDGDDGLVALKAPRRVQPTILGRMQREAELLGYLEHTNIARLVDARLLADRPYLAMELVLGASVHDLVRALLERNRLMPAEASLAIGLGVLAGLAHAHAAKGPDGRPLELVHRDVSPRNIMISSAGEVKLIDFGLVRTPTQTQVTRAGVVVGTLPYLSPEQVLRAPIDHRSDQYSLAVILTELLTGEFLVPLGDRRAAYEAILYRKAPRPSDYSPRLPRAIDLVLGKALEKDPERRFQTTREFRDALADASRTVGRAPPPALAAIVDELQPVVRRRARQAERILARLGRFASVTESEVDLEATVRDSIPPSGPTDPLRRRPPPPPPATTEVELATEPRIEAALVLFRAKTTTPLEPRPWRSALARLFRRLRRHSERTRSFGRPARWFG